MTARGQSRCQMHELAREVLVNEEDLHAISGVSELSPKAATINWRV